MSKDLFADLLGSQTGGKKMANDSNLSLSQRINQSGTAQNGSKGNGVGQWSFDLDLLDHLSSSNRSTPPAQSATPTNNGQNDDFEKLFDVFNQPKKAQPPTNSSGSIGSENLLDGFAETPVQRAEPDLFGSGFIGDSAPPPPKPAKTDERDAILAELVDMGFPIERANRALDSTAPEYDLGEAISFLMNEAHAQAKQQKTREHRLPTQTEHQQLANTEDIGAMVNELSNELKSKAFSLFNTGRKKLQQGIDMYKQQQFEKNDNQPLWMKNQERYKAGSMKLPGEEEDEDDLDKEAIKHLIEQQRQRERELKREKELARAKEAAEQSKNSSLFDEPAPRRRPEPVSSIYDEPLPSRRRRKPETRPMLQQSTPSPSPAPSKPKQADEALLDILSAPPVSASQTKPPPQKSQAKSTLGLPNNPISDHELQKFTDNRTKAADFFKKGDFVQALEYYERSLSSLPANHYLRIIAYSNLSVVLSKLGDPKRQLENAQKGLDTITSGISRKISDLNEIAIEEDKTVKSFWIKLLSKKAESLEHLERFQESLDCYNQLIENGGTSKSVMDGRKRCNDVLKPQPKKQPPKPTKPSTKPTRVPTAQNNEAIRKVKEHNDKQEQIENEKFALHDVVEQKLDQWRQGKEDNIRALLSSLHLILWPELQWKPVGLTDLVLDKKVKLLYMKAVAKTHPDKIANESSMERKLVANGVFISLNQAWDKFKQMNNIQ